MKGYLEPGHCHELTAPGVASWGCVVAVYEGVSKIFTFTEDQSQRMARFTIDILPRLGKNPSLR